MMKNKRLLALLLALTLTLSALPTVWAMENAEAPQESTEATTETTEVTAETTEATVPAETTAPTAPVEMQTATVQSSAPVLYAGSTRAADYTTGMTQVTNLANRYFYLILHRGNVGVTDTVVKNTADTYTGFRASFHSNNATYAEAVHKLDVADLTKWLFEPGSNSGEYYIKSVASGKYMNFVPAAGAVGAMSDTPVATRVYSYTTTVTVDETDTTLVRYALTQTANGTTYVLNQLGGAEQKFNAFGGWTDGDAYCNDPGNLFLLKEAYVAQNEAKVDSVPENIKMWLFDYGPQINDKTLSFIQGTNYGTSGVDGYRGSRGNGGTRPTMAKTLINNYPQNVTENNLSYDYLFNPHSATIDEDTYFANLFPANDIDVEAAPYQYQSIYFPVANEDGSGTGLFQKDSDGYFYYDSALNAAWYNPETDKFVLYDYVVRPPYMNYTDSTAVQVGNFLPLNQGHTTGYVDYGTFTAPNATRPEGAKKAYRLSGTSQKTDVNLWFGMALEFDFYQTEKGMVTNTSGVDVPMEFEFLGDDDVYVYIDDVLILDIGGTHGAEKGTINFATGAVQDLAGSSSTLYSLMKAALGDKLDETEFVDANGDGTTDTFADFTKHTLKFYYLERGGNISYCKLKFNMDPLPTGSVTLRKNVSGINEALSDDQTYQFKVSASHETETIESITYQITGSSGTKTVANNGTISLKDNEIATFTDLPVNTKVTFEEITNDKTSVTAWQLNGQTVEKPEATVGADENEQMAFVCTNTRKTADLTVTKDFSGAQYEPDRTYEMNITIAGKAYTGDAIKGGNTVKITDGKISLKVGESVTIEDIPTGASYSVVESDPRGTSGYQYAEPVYAGATDGNVDAAGMQGNVTADTTVTVTNSHVLADLVIDKETGLEQITANGGEEDKQSFLFQVEGGPADVDMTVIVQNDGSTTIKNLPVGVGEDAKYKVTELTDWSWRYRFQSVTAETDADEVVDTANQSVTFDLTASGETTKFTNKWSQIYWLSDETYYRNLFNNVAPNPTPNPTPTT